MIVTVSTIVHVCVLKQITDRYTDHTGILFVRDTEVSGAEIALYVHTNHYYYITLSYLHARVMKTNARTKNKTTAIFILLFLQKKFMNSMAPVTLHKLHLSISLNNIVFYGFV